MTQSSDFKEISNRDAWGTIRGFVYQIDYTILRWLLLKDNDLLELERGEDIDIIQRDLTKREISRELEQIKYQEANVTLNSDLTLELFRNFYDHILHNPRKNLRFRFVTNSDYGQERPSLFTKGDKGIDIWMLLHKPDTVWEDNPTVETLKAHIQSRILDQMFPDASSFSQDQQRTNAEWQGFHDYLDNADNLRAFILNFEWANERKNQDSVVQYVLKVIRQVFQIEDATAIYERLFVFVFKLLSKKGIKRLDTTLLVSQVQNTNLGTSDHALLDMLKALIGQVDQRLVNLEMKSEEQTKALHTFFKDIEVLKNDATFSFRVQQLSTSAPAPILNGASRTAKIKVVKEFLDLLPWVAFHGINGSGKTQLASLVGRIYQDVFWLDLREYHANLRMSVRAIETFLMTISGCELYSDRKQWVNDVTASLPENCLLVLNDVPHLDGSVPGLEDLFSSLVLALDNSAGKLITTSNFHFPDALIQKCPEACVYVYQEFDFDDEEIIEYLSNQGAPENFFSMVRFVVARAHRNPRLTTAMINHLKAINWGADSGELLETVMNTEFAAGVLENAQQSIIKYIGDQDSKELLYRLSLIDWAFSTEQIHAVSKVETQITQPNEKLQPLLHLWIQVRESSEFEISPLIKSIGLNNLDPESIRKVYVAIGQSILGGKVLNQKSGDRALMAFISGKDYDSAGFVLLKMYEAALQPEQAKIMYGSGFLFYWTDTNFPDQMSLGMKIMIRREQLRLYRLLNKDISQLLDHTRRILQDESVSVIEAATGRMLLLTTYYQDLPIPDFIEYLSFTIEHLEEIAEVLSVFQDGDMLANLIWLPVMRLGSNADVDAWIALTKLFSNRGIDPFGSEISFISLGILCNAIGKREILANDDDAGIAMLTGLFKFLAESKREEMTAYVVRGLSQIESHWYDDSKNAIKLLFKYSQEYTNPHAKFILSGQIGRLYKGLGNKEKEIEFLNQAFTYQGKDYIELIDLLIQAAVSVSKTDHHQAAEYCKRAVETAKSNPNYGKVDLIQLLDEFAVSLWFNGNTEDMFLVLEDIVFKLIEVKIAEPETIWMKLFSLTGHVIGYCSAIITEGKPPKTHHGDYFAPFQGMFYFNDKDYSTHYQSNNDSYTFVLMASLAAGLNKPEKAYEWSLKAFDEARRNGSPEIFYTVSSVSSHFSIINFKPTEAFEACLYNAAIMSHLPGKTEDRKQSLKELAGVNILSEKPGPKWAEAEDTATTFSTVPLFIMLLTAFKSDRFEKNQMRAAYFKMLTTFGSSASDKLLFELVIGISKKVLDVKTSPGILGDRANTFGQQEKRNLQTICLLGVIHLTVDGSERLRQIINIVPYVQKVLSAGRTLGKYTLVPFVQLHAIDIVRSNFKGSEDELAQAETEILNVNKMDDNSLRVIINMARKVVSVDISKNREEWLDGANF